MTKGRKEHEPVRLFWFVVLVAMIAVLVADISRADEISSGRDCAGKSSACANQLVDVPVNIAGDSSKALGLGFSSPSFGVAISQCLATKSSNWVFGAYGKQSVVSNYHCMGLAYLQAGMLTAGEYILCTHTELSDMPDCSAAVGEFSRLVAPEPVETANTDDIDAEYYAQAEMIEDQQMLIADLAAKYENLAQAEPRTIERTVVQQVPALSEKQRMALAQVLAE
jgi:hypothetical protein